MTIPYNSLPSYSELFLKYIENFESLKNFYEYDYRSDEDFLKCIELKKQTYLNGKNFFRNDICEILKEQNENFLSSEKTFDNIKLLNEHDTFAVVTGQQLGFLSGPYYTILKAINTIQLSEKLNKKFPEYKFVPVFWLEADDHDFLEINNINVISKENDLKNIKYFEKGQESEKYLKPAGNIVLDEFTDPFVNELEATFNKTDFTENLFRSIRETYKTGSDIKTAFARFLNSLIGNKGLVFIDPTDAAVKKFLKPVFETELNTSPQVCEKVINTSVELEQSYSVQVKPKPINLFYIHEGHRYLLEPRENDVYALKHSRQKFSREELYGLLESNPERFSWNVVTRPICQDYILPTVAYIGGPSEISYFGQFKEVYKFFNIPMPVIYPRTSVTILENRVKSFLEKNQIKFNELFYEKDLAKKLLKESSVVSADEIFSEMKEELTGLFYTYEKELSRIDVNQTEAFIKRNRQFLESLDVARDKFSGAQSKQNEIISNQLSKVLLYIYPDNTLQERVLNITYFLNKYGPAFTDHLMNEIKIDDFSHQLIDASSGMN
ncbi:MAG: bacillithiol biosynthesis cysteine-adding enzyme BshC [Ignavibacteria bacterium]|nr:bacillithiol biosynthesis cysteine-adding enzyme BshC [Ignavibacteria bacterium]